MTGRKIFLSSIFEFGRLAPLVAAFTAMAFRMDGAPPGEGPTDLHCEWQIEPMAVRDPCPEFYWECRSQGAYRLAVAASATGFTAPLWETVQTNSLPIVEYAGPRLDNGRPYFWRVWVSDDRGRPMAGAPPQRFALKTGPMPHVLPTARTFVNFAGEPGWAKDKIDMCFRKDAKSGRPDILTTRYALICTMVIPSEKADALRQFCAERRVPFEDCFCHFAQDTEVTLHVGAESAKNPREKRLCLGWDPRNDRNGDGAVDDAESTNLINPRATARERKSARIPIYFWGPPRDDYVMNVGNPPYQEFMATVHAPEMTEGFDGLYFDTVPADVPGAGRRNTVVEYPRPPADPHQWLRDVQTLFAKIKLAMPDRLITGNGWSADPMVIDGFQSENWLDITAPCDRWRRTIERTRACDRRGKIQMLQYNPVHDDRLAEFGKKVPGISRERDRLFGLASYYMAHGDFTYFGFGSHPYAHVTELWFDAIGADLGRPEGEFRVFSKTERSTVDDTSSRLPNGGFEGAGDWRFVKPVIRDPSIKHGGGFSALIESDSAAINNINCQHVKLKPRTTYTLAAWIRTEGVVGSPGAQVYPYEFDGASGTTIQITVTGTTGWTQYRHVFQTGDDGDGRINFRMYGATGKAWFDDVMLVEGASYADTVFARPYSRGLVLVKPPGDASFGDETAQQIALSERLVPLSADGSRGRATSELRLRNGEAAILLRP